MLDPSSSTSTFNQRECSRSLAYLRGNSPDYMGISPVLPGWRPRRTSYEDRRGVVGVPPSQVNTLVPYIPPIDTSLPPPSREWLDEMAKRFLANAHADFEDSHRDTTNDVAGSRSSLSAQDSFSFDYDSDSTLDGPVTRPSAPQQQPPQQTPQPESESNSTLDTNMDTDTDTDTDSDDGYDWNNPPQFHFPESKWIIPRKRPSVVIINDKDVTMNVSPPPSNDEHARKRGGRKGASYTRATKSRKRYENDTPARYGGKSASPYYMSLGGGMASMSRPPASSVTTTALQMKHVRIASPCTTSPPAFQPHSSASPKPPKLFPCTMDGCNHICASAGDLQRHQQSLRHRSPAHACLACGKSYTRPDALKRHLNSKAACRRVHATKLANDADLEQVPAEANTEAV